MSLRLGWVELAPHAKRGWLTSPAGRCRRTAIDRVTEWAIRELAVSASVEGARFELPSGGRCSGKGVGSLGVLELRPGPLGKAASRTGLTEQARRCE